MVTTSSRPRGSARVPVARATASVVSPHRRRKAPVIQTVLSPQAAPPSNNEPVLPAEDRLAQALLDCQNLDHELKVIESSGHSRLGVFAKALGAQQQCKLAADAAKDDTSQHLPEDPLSDTAFIEDDDVTNDPFFHRFYDEEGKSIYEQLLRARTKVVVLTKLVHSRKSLQYIRAEMELGEAYTRMNLWKQAHSHMVIAHELVRELDNLSANRHDHEKHLDNSALTLFGQVLEAFYERQLHTQPQGEVIVEELSTLMETWIISSSTTSSESSQFAAIFKPSNLSAIVGAVPFLHWQQLLLSLERRSVLFQEFLHDAEMRLPAALLTALRQQFAQLDPSRFGVAPVRSLVQSLGTTCREDDQLMLMLSTVREALVQHDERANYPSITWGELLHVAISSLRIIDSSYDPVRELRPRLKFFFGRFFHRKGQLDDALKYLTLAIVEEEKLHGMNGVSSTLVDMYLAIAETVGVRYKQNGVIAQQQAFEVTDKWLKSPEGTRRVRAKALEIMDAAARSQSTALPRKTAETQARDDLMKEYTALSLVRPDTTVIEEGVEFCTKAWRLQDRLYGADHVTTARVHVTLAQLHAIKKDWDESIQCYRKAITIYEAACNGPVPASAWLQLEVAKLHQHQCNDPIEAAKDYEIVGDFFHSFAMEFASSNSTRRDCCAQAIEAYRLWSSLSRSSGSTTMEKQRQVMNKIYDATVDGYGEFAIETAERAAELGQFLVQKGELRHAERHLRTAWYIFESHFGPNDRRTRRARKELVTLSSELKDAALDEADDGHEWLTL